jgi:hypothetical protein
VAPVIVGVVKFIVKPKHTGVLLEAVGVAGIEFTVMVIAFDVAGLPVTPDKFDVITHVITSPVTRVVVVNVELVAPDILVPFFFH